MSTEQTTNEKESVKFADMQEDMFNKMIDGAYNMATKMPLAGPVAQKVFDKIDFKDRSKVAANYMFNPFYTYKKIKSKLSKEA